MNNFFKSIFIFRRDLRLVDNTALNLALRYSKEVYPIFFLDPRQVKDNDYYSANSVLFMKNSLIELSKEIHQRGGYLNIIAGDPAQLLPEIKHQIGAQAVFLNYDYTPFSKVRDLSIRKACEKSEMKFFPAHDLMLNAPGVVLKDDGEPYSVYTYYRKKAEKLTVNPPAGLVQDNFARESLSGADLKLLEKVSTPENEQMLMKGGRKEGLDILKNLPTSERYQQERDFPAINSSTKLSAHLKFGTVSAREVFQKLSKINPKHILLAQLHWRDFFTQISFFYPEVYGTAFQKKFRKIKWRYDQHDFQSWCDGQTGFPIVDAGMRELNTSGYMHNRVRMIVASFLTKNLRIDWRWGEKYFAQKLTDYDPALNNGNWQWAASTGCDAQPYFRIFNAWTQQKKFDAEAQYIKKWVPELSPLTPKQIHNEEFLEIQMLVKYPRPMVNHAKTREQALLMFKEALVYD